MNKDKEITTFARRLVNILKLRNEYIRNIRLANFMSDMESAFDIPMLNRDRFNQKYQDVITIYMTASGARST
ncbi:hypothetical protein SAMN05421743_12175 [Thalassobacillus cyri]|uniref:Uncharacterized protein n=1 Tax=Thalassobacillus cyri TaxID=571932 RepID=A0A1H4H4N4_9BACI|nr:hypothetical protein [Thalassobacillus cyri]SEB16002.1 hypothetical protein SAMN05421743_12175 [Thalassobacillus cyri]